MFQILFFDILFFRQNFVFLPISFPVPFFIHLSYSLYFYSVSIFFRTFFTFSVLFFVTFVPFFSDFVLLWVFFILYVFRPGWPTSRLWRTPSRFSSLRKVSLFGGVLTGGGVLRGRLVGHADRARAGCSGMGTDIVCRRGRRECSGLRSSPHRHWPLRRTRLLRHGGLGLP